MLSFYKFLTFADHVSKEILCNTAILNQLKLSRMWRNISTESRNFLFWWPNGIWVIIILGTFTFIPCNNVQHELQHDRATILY